MGVTVSQASFLRQNLALNLALLARCPCRVVPCLATRPAFSRQAGLGDGFDGTPWHHLRRNRANEAEKKPQGETGHGVKLFDKQYSRLECDLYFAFWNNILILKYKH